MKRRDEVLVGVLMTIAIAIGIIGTIWLSRGGLSSGYPLFMVITWGAGLKQGAPVLLSGINVGYVGDVLFRQDGTILVTLRVKNEFKIPEGTTATVEANGFFGDKLVALRPAGVNPQMIAAGDTVPVGAAAPDVAQLLTRMDSIGGRLSDMSKAIEVEMVANGGLADFRSTLARTNQLVGQLSGIAAEQSRQLTLTMGSLRRATAAIDSTVVDSTVRNLQATSAQVAALTTELRQTSTTLSALVAKADTGSGSVAKLLNDPELYTDVRKLVQRLDSLAADVKKNPKRYINVKVF